VLAASSNATCHKDTGGKCALQGCQPVRNARCETLGTDDYRCMCGPGDCAVDGQCLTAGVCNTVTQGTCQFFGCHAERGPTDCRQLYGAGLGGSWICVCKPGYCLIHGVCTKSPDVKGVDACRTDTGGTCLTRSCSEERNATCINTKCLCGAGTCAGSDGRCHPATAKEMSESEPQFENVVLAASPSVSVVPLAFCFMVLLTVLVYLKRRPRVTISAPESLLG